MRTEKITDRSWKIYDGSGREVGTVIGDGPTRDTRFKAIGASDAAIDADHAPGRYAPSLHDAAMMLADPHGLDEATRATVTVDGVRLGTVVQTWDGQWIPRAAPGRYRDGERDEYPTRTAAEDDLRRAHRDHLARLSGR